MTRSSAKKGTECHVLDFFYDDDDGCALTVFTNGTRFHIVVDPEQLKSDSKKENKISTEYRKLLSAVQDESSAEEQTDTKKQKDLEAAATHGLDAAAPDSSDSGYSDTENSHKSENDSDSAVDVIEDHHDVKEIGIRDSGIVLGERYAPEMEMKLQNWMLSPFEPIFADLAPASKAPKQPTLEEWYHGPAYFYNLEIDGDQLSASQDESSKELSERMNKLIPRMPVPKSIGDLNIPMFQAKDITVIDEGTEPEPYHPTRVKVDDKIYFLKLVDMTQYQPTKREIQLLKEVEQKGLHKKFNVPQISGLVYEKSKTEIMGFLQTDVQDPTPLTKMLDSDVIEEERERWAKETRRIIDLLHENGIIWGDAKADNFMVDKKGELWIIDFGGSYTDGWVDPELMETEEGDNMGTEKIINALEDPEANTFEPGKEDDGDQTEPKVKSSKKRSREEDEDAIDDSCTKKKAR